MNKIDFIKLKIKEKKASFSLLYVILALIAVIMITGLMDVMHKAYVINEVQSIMDVAGVSSLRVGVDEKKLRLEIFDINETYVKNTFKYQVTGILKNSSNIKSYNLSDRNIKLNVIDSTWGLGDSVKKRPQAILDAVITLEIKTSVFFDTVPGISEKFYRSLSGDNFIVTLNGKTGDGYSEVMIRSVSRLVYK